MVVKVILALPLVYKFSNPNIKEYPNDRIELWNIEVQNMEYSPKM